MCSNVRALSAAVAGYLLGGLFGGGGVSVALMVAAGLAMFTWSKLAARRFGPPSCGLPAGRLREQQPAERKAPFAATQRELAVGGSKPSADEGVAG